MHHPYPADFKEIPLYQGVYNTVHAYGGNINWVTDGLGRKGKSRTNLKLGYDLDRHPKTFKERFSIDNVCFSFDEAKAKVTSKLPVGTVVIWEEAGSVFGANARQWQSVINQKASNLFQIVGRRQLIFIVNLPNFMMLDKQVRMLCHIRTTCYGVKTIGNSRGVLAKTKILSPHHYLYESFSSPIYNFDGGGKFRVKEENMLFQDAPKELVKAYLEKEKEWKDKMENSINKGSEPEVVIKPVGIYDQALNYALENIEKVEGSNGAIDKLAVVDLLKSKGLRLNPRYLADVIAGIRYERRTPII